MGRYKLLKIILKSHAQLGNSWGIKETSNWNKMALLANKLQKSLKPSSEANLEGIFS